MPQIFEKAQTYLPSAVTENAQMQVRGTKYGDLFVAGVLAPPHTQSLEGSFFLSRPTPAAGGSGTPMGIQQTFSDTANIALMLNNGDAAKTYLPVYIKTRCTAAGATTTSAEIAVEVDTTNRYSSGGSTMTVYKSNPSASAPASQASVRIGAITAAAASAARQWISSYLIRSAVAPAWIVGDVDWFFFGMDGSSMPYSKAGQPVDTTAAPGTVFTWPLPQCAVPPGGTLLVHIANVANSGTAPSFEWELGWIER